MSKSRAVDERAKESVCKTAGSMSSDGLGLKGVMRSTDSAQTVPQLALRIKDAAQALAISVESFERYVEPEMKLLRLGTMKLVPTCELQRFIDENACRIGSDW